MNNSCMEESVMFIFPFGIQVFDFGIAQIVKFKCKHFLFLYEKGSFTVQHKEMEERHFHNT